MNYKLDFLDRKKILAETENVFEFKFNSKKKIYDLKLKSKVNFKEIFFDQKLQNLIFLKNGVIITNYADENLNIEVDSGYAFINKNYSNNEKDLIKINFTKKKNQISKIKALIENKNNSFNSKELLNYFNINKNLFKNQDLKFGSKNHVSFDLNKKSEIKNIKINSKINLDNFIINSKSSTLKKIFPNYKDSIKLKKNFIKIDYLKNNINVEFEGDYSIDDKFDEFKFKIFR